MGKSKKHASSELGQGFLEYALILVFVAVITVVSLHYLGFVLRDVYGDIVKYLEDPTKPPRITVPSVDKWLREVNRARASDRTFDRTIRIGEAACVLVLVAYVIKIVWQIISLLAWVLSKAITLGKLGFSSLSSAFASLSAAFTELGRDVLTRAISYLSAALAKAKSVWIWSHLVSASIALAFQQASVALRILQHLESFEIGDPETQLALFSSISIAYIRIPGDVAANLERAGANYLRAQEVITKVSDESRKTRFRERISGIGQEMGQTLNRVRKQDAWGVAAIEDFEEDHTLYVNETYILTTGIGWGDVPAEFRTFAIEPISLPESVPVEPLQFDVAVWAEDMDIEPPWVRTLELNQNLKPPCLIRFKLTPRVRGQKTIRVDFYYQRHWLQQIELEVKVIKSPSTPLKVGMVLGVSGLGDKSFNDAAYDGLILAQQLYGIELEIADSGTLEEIVALIQQWCEVDCDLVIALGHHNVPAIAQVAEAFPENRFAIIDAELSGENVWSAVFREYEGSYVAGVLAALVTRENRIGFIGNSKTLTSRKIESAFLQGIKSVNPDAILKVVYIDRVDGKLMDQYLTETMCSSGVDVIYQSAAEVGIDAIEAAKKLGKLIISTRGDHRSLAPSVVLTSLIKHVYRPVLDVVEAVLENRFEGGKTESYGIANGGISLAPIRPEVAERLPPDITLGDLSARVNEALEAVISGQITVDLGEIEATISSSFDSDGSSHPV